MDFDGICFTIETCLCDEPHNLFYIVHSVFRGENPAYVIFVEENNKQTTLTFACIQTFTDQFLSNLV